MHLNVEEAVRSPYSHGARQRTGCSANAGDATWTKESER